MKVLTVEGGRLRLIDPATGERLLRPEEARAVSREALIRAQREAERAQREAERAKQAEDRAATAEADLKKLRALLARER